MNINRTLSLGPDQQWVRQIQVGQRLPVQVLSVEPSGQAQIKVDGYQISALLETEARAGDRFYVRVQNINQDGLVLVREGIPLGQPGKGPEGLTAAERILLSERGLPLEPLLIKAVQEFPANSSGLINMLKMAASEKGDLPLALLGEKLGAIVPQWQNLQGKAGAEQIIALFKELGLNYEQRVAAIKVESGSTLVNPPQPGNVAVPTGTNAPESGTVPANPPIPGSTPAPGNGAIPVNTASPGNTATPGNAVALVNTATPAVPGNPGVPANATAPGAVIVTEHGSVPVNGAAQGSAIPSVGTVPGQSAVPDVAITPAGSTPPGVGVNPGVVPGEGTMPGTGNVNPGGGTVPGTAVPGTSIPGAAAPGGSQAPGTGVISGMPVSPGGLVEPGGTAGQALGTMPGIGVSPGMGSTPERAISQGIPVTGNPVGQGNEPGVTPGLGSLPGSTANQGVSSAQGVPVNPGAGMNPGPGVAADGLVPPGTPIAQGTGLTANAGVNVTANMMTQAANAAEAEPLAAAMAGGAAGVARRGKSAVSPGSSRPSAGGTDPAQAAQLKETFKGQLMEAMQSPAMSAARRGKGDEPIERLEQLLNYLIGQQVWLKSGSKEEAFVLMHIPLQYQGEFYNAQVAIESGRNGNKLDLSHCRIGLLVNTPHLGEIGVDAWFFEGTLSIRLLTSDQKQLGSLLEEETAGLKENFLQMGIRLGEVKAVEIREDSQFLQFIAGKRVSGVDLRT